MADKPTNKKSDLVSYIVKVDGAEVSGTYDVTEIEVNKEINKIPTATVVLLDGDPSAETFEISEKGDFEPGKTLAINLGYHNETEQIFEGKIVSQRIRLNSKRNSELVVKCADAAASMTVGRYNHYYLDKKDSDIWGEVIGRHSGLSNELDATAETHKEVIQFYSTDWDFIISRAEINGMVVSCDDGKVQVLKPRVAAGPDLEVLHGTSIVRADLELDSRHQLPDVTTKAWDFSKNEVVEKKSSEPSVNAQGNIDGKKLSGVLEAKDFTLHSVAPLEKSDLKIWADARLLKSRLARVRGKVVFQGHAAPKPNSILELKGLGDRFNGKAFVSGVYHSYRDSQWETEVSIGLNPRWYTETKTDVTVASASGQLPGVDGLQIGTVQKIDEDPDGEVRVLVDVPMIAPSGDGVWARLTNFYSTGDAGWFFYPELGDEVILGFLNNDPRFPIILGSVYSKTHEPHSLYTPDADNTYKALVTNSHMRIEFEDIKRILTITTPNGNTMCFDDDEGTIWIEDENSNKITMNADGIQLYTPADLLFEVDGNYDIKVKGNMNTKADMDLTIAAMNITSTADVGWVGEGTTAELAGSAQTTISGGVVMIN